MPASTAYTEITLAELMIVELGRTAGVLGWSSVTPRVEYAVRDTARAFGVTDVATVTDMVGLEAVARLSIWRAVMADRAPEYDTTIDGESRKPSQTFVQAEKMVRYHEDTCRRLGVGDVASSGVVRVNELTRNDPYTVSISAAEF